MEKSSPTAQPMGWAASILALTVCVARGGNQVAIKTALESLAPLWSAFWRMFVSAATVWSWSRLRGVSLLPDPDQRRPLALLGALFTVQISILHWGADLTSPAYAVTLINTHPIFANFISHFFVPEDRLTSRRLAGLALSFLGICAVFLGQPEPALARNPFLGNLLILLSGLLVGARTVYIQRIVQRMEPAKAIFWQMLISLPVLAAVGWALGDSVSREPFNWKPAAAIGYQGIIVGGLALILWVHLLRRHTPGSVSVFSFVTPMAGILLSAWLFGETLTPRLLLGVAAVLGGIGLVARSGPPQRPGVAA